MPFAIDEERFKIQQALDISAPQGTALGLPVKAIPHMEYPRAVYKHPVKPYREIIHRNANHEVVNREMVATEHISKVVATEGEFMAALEDGWVKEPYMPKPPADPDAALYEPKGKKA